MSPVTRYEARGRKPRALLFRSAAAAIALGTVVSLLGCQRAVEPQLDVPTSGNHPPSIRAASLLPSPLVLNGPLSVLIDAQDLDRNPLSFRYQWSINGQLIPHKGVQLPPELLKRGDRVAVEIWPHDGTIEGASYTTPTAVVVNSPPVVANVAVEPTTISLGMRVHAHAQVDDADHDLVQLSYRWWKNDTLLQEGEAAELDTTPFARGDALSVEVTASDSSGPGAPVRSTPVTIVNTPPRIVSIPPTSLSEDHFVYQVQAADAESDMLTFSLERAPTNMTIHEESGLINWRVAPGLGGKHKVRILVTDSGGAASFQEFEINVSTPTPPAGAT